VTLLPPMPFPESDQRGEAAGLAEQQDEPQNWAAASYIPLVVSNAALAGVTALAPTQVALVAL